MRKILKMTAGIPPSDGLLLSSTSSRQHNDIELEKPSDENCISPDPLAAWPTVIFLDWITRPAIPDFSAQKRAELDAITANMKIYQFRQCPFCVKTRRNIRRLGLNIETRDARNDPRWNSELINEGGKYQVPCLRLRKDDGSTEWMYGSNNIIEYLDKRFG